jgi:NhaA family Na+:H+ antiporter
MTGPTRDPDVPDGTDVARGGPAPDPSLRDPWGQTDRFVPRTVIQPLQEFVQSSTAGSAVLLVAVVVALVWANSPWHATYHDLFETEIALHIGSWHLGGSVHFWINDGLMTLFFFEVGLEIKRELTIGELRDWRAAVLPVVAALGGMLAPALLYLAVAGSGVGAQGWGIPMATDIAFALGAITLAAAHAPPNLKPLLLTLAIVDDIGAILVIAIAYSGGVRLVPLEEAALMLVLIVVFRRMHVRSLLPYWVVAVLFWYFTYRSGIHPTIAGVILGLLTPAFAFQRPRAVSEEARRVADATVDDPHPPDADAPEWLRLSRLSREAIPPLARLEHALLPWTAFVIVPLFALANAGVTISSTSISDAVSSRVALGIILGLVLGKPLGVLAASWLSVRTRAARLPSGVGWGAFAGVGAIAGIGFTMSLFVAQLAFSDPRLLDEAKLAILAASATAGLAGYLTLWMSSARRGAAG